MRKWRGPFLLLCVVVVAVIGAMQTQIVDTVDPQPADVRVEVPPADVFIHVDYDMLTKRSQLPDALDDHDEPQLVTIGEDYSYPALPRGRKIRHRGRYFTA